VKIQTIQYHKVFNLGNYSNEKIGVDIVIGEGEDPLEAFAEAKRLVEKSHKFFQDLPNYEQAKKIVANPDDFTGRTVKQAHEVIKAFEENYPDYMNKFSMPVSRTLEQGRTNDDDDHYEEQPIVPQAPIGPKNEDFDLMPF
jgi:hypothetical protein